MSLIEGKCPQCQSELNVNSYNVNCTKCRFQADYGEEEIRRDLSPGLLQALLLLASHAGKVSLVYASLRDLSTDRKQDRVINHPNFDKKEYQRLLNYYNNLAQECADKIDLEEAKKVFAEILEG